jgi:hypothetical protein
MPDSSPFIRRHAVWGIAKISGVSPRTTPYKSKTDQHRCKTKLWSFSCMLYRYSPEVTIVRHGYFSQNTQWNKSDDTKR